MTPNPEAEPFSKRLRERTWAAHGTAEQSGFMPSLVRGELVRAAYGDLVAELSYVYAVIDAAADVMWRDPIAGGFVFDELRRDDAFALDLAVLLDDPAREAVEMHPATARYVERLDAVCTSWPGGFVAHHYTRYLGDLSGGQMIRRALAAAYDLRGDHGLASLTYDRVTDPKAFKEEYRRRLDAAPWDADEQEAVIEEVLLGYRLNAELVDELGRIHRTTTVA